MSHKSRVADATSKLKNLLRERERERERERVVNRLPLMTYGLKLSLEA